MDEVVVFLKDDLASVSETASKALATPAENADLFPDMKIALQMEQMFFFLAQRDATKGSGGMPAADLDLDLIQLIKSRTQPQEAAAAPVAAGESKEDDDGAAAAAAETAAAEEAARGQQAQAEAAAAAVAQKEAEEHAAAEAEQQAAAAAEEAE